MKPSNGMTGVFGLKFRDGPDHSPVIDSVAPDSPAAQQGLRAGMEIDEINGVKVTSAKQAAAIVLGIDKLDLMLRQRRAERPLFWSVDDPPESQIHGSGPLKIYGLEIAGSDGQRP